MMVPGGVGSGLPQRWQVRSPGGLATPQASLVHRLGGPSATAPMSPAIRKPQSMQAMAPSSKGALHAGQMFFVPTAGVAAAAPSVLVVPDGGVRAADDGGAAGAGVDGAGLGAAVPPAATAAAGCGAFAMITFLQPGHCTCFPTRLSGIVIR